MFHHSYRSSGGDLAGLPNPPLSPSFTLHRDPAPFPFLFFTGTATHSNPDAWVLGPGSLWIASDALAQGGAAGSYAGLRINGGDIQTSVPAAVVPGGARIAAGSSVLIQLHPVAPADKTFGIPPASATLAFAPAARAKIGADKASLDPGSGTVTLKRSKNEAVIDSKLGCVIVPFDPDSEGVALNLGGPAASITGACTFTGGGWALTLRTISAAGPVFDAGSGGAPVLICGQGLIANWPGLTDSLELGPAYILAGNGERQIIPAGGAVRRVPYSAPGWTNANEDDPGVTTPQLFEFLAESATRYVETAAGNKSLSVSGVLQAGIAPLFTVSGNPLGVLSPATLEILQSPSGNSITFTSAAGDEEKAGKTAIALANALLTVTKSPGFKLTGTPDENGAIATGQLAFTFGIYQLLPILPDPYAANFDCVSGEIRYTITGHLTVNMTWEDSGQPTIAFTIAPAVSPELPQVYVPEPIPGSPDVPDGRMWHLFEDWLNGVPRDGRRLLDVSGNADQLGVVFGGPKQDGSLAITAATLETFGSNVHVFALPQVAWEPVTNVKNPNVLPFPDEAVSQADGDRAQIGVNTVKLVPVHPVGAATRLMAEYRQGARAGAIFTLPFGISAFANFGPAQQVELVARSSLTLVRPSFAEYTGARYFRLLPGTRMVGGGVAQKINNFLSGAALQTNNITRDGNNAEVLPPRNLLGVVDTFFNTAFGEEVPLSLLDISGFGESTFSDWLNEDKSPPDVSQVHFHILNGRTSREVVQVKTYLWPCQAILVRTITIERSGGARVMRYDSGWVATTPGLFTGANPDIVFHTGAVRGMYNIREIRETSQIVKTADGQQLQAVYFDTDVAIDDVIQGQNSDKRVPARNQLGYVQFPAESAAGMTVPAALSAAALNDLLTNHGPVGGALDCVMNVGGSGLQERTFALYSEPVSGKNFAVVLYGMPLFAGGPWSVVHISHGKFEGEVHPVDPRFGVPLIRENGGPAYRFADSADLLSAATPNNDYALLYTGHTHRILFPRPLVKPGQKSVFGEIPGLLADPYAMLAAAGVFPATSAALQFHDPNYILDVTPAGLKTRNLMQVDKPAQRTLADTSSWALLAVYDASDIQVNIDPSVPPNLADPNTLPVLMTKLSTILNTSAFSNMFTIQNDVPELGALKPQLPHPTVILGDAFKEFNNIASALQNIGLAGLDFSLSASGMENQTYRLQFTGKLRLATKDGDRVDLGIGKMSGELEVGGDIAASLTAAPKGRIWFDVGGDLQQAIIPDMLYAGGMLKFHIAIDENGQADWQLDAGTVASIGGDLIPDLVSLEATVHYAYLLTPTLKPGVRLGMDARAKLVDGLVGVKFGVDASVSISRPDPKSDKVTIEGDVMAMGQITVAWVFDPEFSRQLHFKQDIELRYVFFAAVTGLLPLPV